MEKKEMKSPVEEILEELLKKYADKFNLASGLGEKLGYTGGYIDYAPEISQAKAKLDEYNKKKMLEVIKLFEEYIILLGEELDELAPFADVHGWKSSRYEEGKKMRKKIKECRDRINKGG